MENLTPLESSWNCDNLSASKSVTDPLEEVIKDYVDIIGKTILPEHRDINEKVGLLFTYTAMHGVGYRYIKEVFREIGVQFEPVLEQRDPHPDFPTVK